jgi:radical SAM-linked protein
MTAAAPRVRIRFAKRGKVRFTSHRDVARIWERALRRAGIPIAYTEGFSPRPKLSFGLALSTGHESNGEYLDVALRQAPGPVAVERLPALLGPVLPAGIEMQSAVALPPGAESLQQAVTSCTWHIEVGDVAPPDAATAVARTLAAPGLTLTRERKGQRVTDDVRPAILDLRVLGPVTEVRAPPGRTDHRDRPHLVGDPGHSHPPMDAGRRRPARGHRPRAGSDAASARREARVMRRDPTHVRDRRFRSGGAEPGP